MLDSTDYSPPRTGRILARPLTLETTIVQAGSGRTIDVLVIPSATLALVGLRDTEAADALGLTTGLRLSTADELEDFLLASLVGRAYAGSDEASRWRARNPGADTAANATFAHELACGDLVPIAASLIRGTSLSALLLSGSAWTLSGGDPLFRNPAVGSGALFSSELGLTIAALSRGVRDTVLVAVKYRLRQRLAAAAAEQL